jgi:hypothetical protein
MFEGFHAQLGDAVVAHRWLLDQGIVAEHISTCASRPVGPPQARPGLTGRRAPQADGGAERRQAGIGVDCQAANRQRPSWRT